MTTISNDKAGTSGRVYQALARDLKDAGVEAAFGLMSDDTALFITALEGEGIRFFGTRHENNAVAMAEGYAAAANRLGVAVIGRGPGTANCINALVHVSRTRAPLLVVMGEAPRRHKGRNGFGPDYKGLDGQRLVSAVDIPVFVATRRGRADRLRRCARGCARRSDRGASSAGRCPARPGAIERGCRRTVAQSPWSTGCGTRSRH